jgi:predicted ATPase/DNA-binding SARP family transcriptional activator
MAGDITVALLGPVELASDGVLAPVAGVKLQTLLAMLALAAPHPVSDDRLLEELWGDDQPAKPANAMQALVSNLRRLLGRDAVERQGAGYVLRVDPDRVDATRLDRLVQAGRDAVGRGDHTAAGEQFRAAAALVRGAPLGELVDRWFARDAAARLQELVLAAEEGLIDAELATGHHADVLARLHELIAAHPLRERFRAQLIVALYRCGRQADALAAYRDARDHLLDELGLDPGPELRALERAVLAQDPALDAPIVVASAVVVRSALPVALTSFVGRGRELTDVVDTLGRARLVTVVGPGGVGKSRLTLELAHRVASDREVWFIELAPLVDGAAVADAVAAGIGAPERAPDAGRAAPTATQRAIERLGDRDAVVILDNCEHVADDVAAVVVALLRGCPNVRILATSREPLTVDGEHQVPLEPLDDATASTLFVERASAVQPLIATDGEHDPAVATLVRHLDGLPLAIELAAARTKTLPIAEIASRLHERFRLLRRTSRGAMARHAGLEAAIAWSYDLLFDDDRRAFRRFAVFSGGAMADAAEWVCGADALELASRLVDRSLLRADTGGHAVRFTMLESLRAYGIERLDDEGELDAVRADHVAWCVDLAARAHQGVRGPDQLEWLRRLDDEHDNLRAALAHAVAHDPESALRLIGDLILPWWFRGRRQEIREWSEAALAAADGRPSAARSQVLAMAGLVAEPGIKPGAHVATDLHDELLLAEHRQREALAFDQAGDDGFAIANDCLVLLATLTRQASIGERVDAAEVDTLRARAASTYERLGDDYGMSVTMVTDAMLAVAQGDLDRARSQAAAAEVITRRTGELFGSSRLEYVLGMLADLDGDAATAYGHIERSLRLVDRLGIHQAVTAQARMLVPLAARMGDAGLAAQWRSFVESRGEGWTHFDATLMAAAQNRSGLRARATGAPERAATAHRAARDWYADANVPAGIAFSESCLGFLAADRGDHDAARDHHAAALAAALASEDGAALGLALEGAAATAAAHGEGERAAALLGAARAAWSQVANAEPTHRGDIDAVAAVARAALGDEAFERAIAAGAAAGAAEVLVHH